MSIDEREVDSVLEGAGKSLLDIVEEKNRTLNKVNMDWYRMLIAPDSTIDIFTFLHLFKNLIIILFLSL